MSKLNLSLLLVALISATAANAAYTPASSPAATAPGGQHGHGGEHGRSAARQEWTSFPLLVRAMSSGQPERGAPVLMATKNIQPDKRLAYAPSGDAPRDLEMTLAGAKLEALPKVGNYYWLTAREEHNDKVIVASTSYYFTNPGPAPTKMLLMQKHELELIPQPLPREHGNYRENEDWKFMVRFNGQSLANQTVRLDTQNGTKSSFVSNSDGVVTVRFPADFKAAEEKKGGGGAHDHGPRRIPFVLETEYTAGGRQYVTAFNYVYGADAYSGRSLAWGAGFTLFGMVLASPLLRRRPDAGKAKAAVPECMKTANNNTAKGE